MPVIDADAHVIETERTWDYLEPGAAKLRPVLVAPTEQPDNLTWMVDGKLRRRAMLFRGGQRQSTPRGRNTETPEEAREMADLDLRIRHLDTLGIDTQVLHNTLFIEQVADREETDIAVCKSWNRWLADIWSRGNGRFRWSCMPPLMNINQVLDEIRFSKAHGAVAVCMRPIEGTRTLTDPYFYPVYEEASKLNMAIAVHIANGNAMVCDVLRSPYDPGSSFGMFRAMTAVACHSYIMSELPRLFPDLRWGFIEASAKWVPWIVAEAAARHESAGKPFPTDVFKEYRVYVTCQNNDDLPYILKYAGENSIVIGTDYGHFDPSSEVDAISVFKRRTDISQETMHRILEENPGALYGL